jgi:hypothetical protein
MADQKQDYEKGNKSGPGMSGAKGGGSGGEKSGPTGSSRHYPKGKGNGMSTSGWNPQKLPASTYGICGV